MAEAGAATTRAEVQRWIGEGRVQLDGRAVDKNTALRAGARLTVTPGPPPASAAEPDASVPFEVVHEDEWLIVVDKPAGVVVHPARGHRGGTLVNGLLARGGFDRDNADPRDPEGPLRPGIVHRLDKDTSGVMVVAKSAACREGLKALFATHDIERSYLAITAGRTAAARFDTRHGRHPRHRLKFTSLGRGEGKRAITEVAVEARAPAHTLVRCTLQTGRTHQIRVHLAEQAKTPVLGDRLYGRPAPELIERQALHAAVLGFVHPMSGERLRFERAMPDDMQRAWRAVTTPST